MNVMSNNQMSTVFMVRLFGNQVNIFDAYEAFVVLDQLARAGQTWIAIKFPQPMSWNDAKQATGMGYLKPIRFPDENAATVLDDDNQTVTRDELDEILGKSIIGTLRRCVNLTYVAGPGTARASPPAQAVRAPHPLAAGKRTTFVPAQQTCVRVARVENMETE